jgi:hypothetical protein
MRPCRTVASPDPGDRGSGSPVARASRSLQSLSARRPRRMGRSGAVSVWERVIHIKNRSREVGES